VMEIMPLAAGADRHDFDGAQGGIPCKCAAP
jgi:hypothetical protein